jgi:hypothetical protein
MSRKKRYLRYCRLFGSKWLLWEGILAIGPDTYIGDTRGKIAILLAINRWVVVVNLGMVW